MNTSTLTAALTAAFLLAVPAAVLAAPPTPQRFQPSDAQRERLDRGEIIARAERGDLIRMEIVAVIDAPLEDVWRVVWDFGSAADWVPDMVSTEVVERGNGWFTADAITGLPFPLRDRSYRLRVARHPMSGDVRASHWENETGHGNINVLRGFWVVEPWQDDPARTLARQVTWMDFGLIVPDGMVARAARRELPATMEALRRHVRSR